MSHNQFDWNPQRHRPSLLKDKGLTWETVDQTSAGVRVDEDPEGTRYLSGVAEHIKGHPADEGHDVEPEGDDVDSEGEAEAAEADVRRKQVTIAPELSQAIAAWYSARRRDQ
jgi:hypothetical protein